MTGPMLELSAFHNWCDRACESCPVSQACPIPGETDSLDEVLARTERMLESLCAGAGISLDSIEPPPPPSIDAVALHRAATVHAFDLHRVGVSPDVLLLVCSKVVRVASDLDSADELPWQADAVPNLLLIEKLLDQAEAELARRTPRWPRRVVDAATESGRRLRVLLAPLFETIPTDARSVLAAMIAAGCAPSPFVRTSPGAPTAATG